MTSTPPADSAPRAEPLAPADPAHTADASVDDDVLARFSPPTRTWFTEAFAAPTPAQAAAWASISSGEDTLVVAPTGSGKTLSAFLWGLDRLATSPRPDPERACRILYVSPLKALAVDVERNLRSPLVGIERAAARLDEPFSHVTVATRSGDTPARERAAFTRRPSDILITTPESLFLLLTSRARESLVGVEAVIVDEIHAVAGTKRGAHLAVSLARLDALAQRRPQRIGLSATVRPVEEVGRFLSGTGQVRIVAPPAAKRWDLDVVVPVPDMGELGAVTEDLSGPAAGAENRSSIWPHVEERIVDLVAEHTSTLVFANSRRLAERLTSRLNEIWAERLEAAGPAPVGGPEDTKDTVDAAGTEDTGEPVVGVVTSDVAHPDGAEGGQGDPGLDQDGDDDDWYVDPATHDAPAPRPPAQLTGQSGTSAGAPPVLARAHHGSVSKEVRAEIEDALKAGRLPAVVATSSLELGIDMGAIDLVVQVESPPSVASGLQRVGRAGHQVGAVSRGVFLPKYRGDLVQSAVVVEQMRRGGIEALRIPANPLDVLAQQVVAMCALDDWAVDDLLRVVRESAPYATLSRPVLESVLDMLAGRYPSEEFAELRPRIVWDRVTNTLTGRPGAQRLAVTSGGTIPDRGLYGVFLASGDERASRRVGELDEEMVYESRVGDVFTLGTSTWRIEDITHDRVLVSPAPGAAGRLPFWKGDTLGRPAELGAAVGAFVGAMAADPPEASRVRLLEAGLDDWAADNLLAYVREQSEATGHVPDDRTIVVERFRDEIGDWRIVVHSPFGSQVHAPWALCIAARMEERFGLDVQAMHGDDGIVLRLPDVEFGGGSGGLGSADGPPGGPEADGWSTGPGRPDEVVDAIVLAADDVRDLVTERIGGSALFASRFRECAARALLLPRRNPGRRQALWQQRQRSASLLAVASRYESFPIVLEAVRECLRDVFDVDGLVDLMSRIASRAVRVVEVETPTASPFARSLMFGYVAQYLYEGDAPLAERRAAALSLDPELLADLLGTQSSSLADLLDPEAVRRTEAQLQCLEPDRRARHAEDVADLVRRLGPLSEAEVAARTREDVAAHVPGWLDDLERARRLVRVRVAGAPTWAAVEDAGRLRDALGVALPVGLPEAFLSGGADPLADLVSRHARTHGPFGAADVARRFGLGIAVVRSALGRLVADGRVVTGHLRPLHTGPSPEDASDGARPEPGAGGAPPPASGEAAHLDYCDTDVLRILKRRSLALLRAEVEPVEQADLARFVPAWQGIGGDLRGVDGVMRAVEQLAGAVLPASALDSLVLPARVRGYRPNLLDELMAAGEVTWQGHGSLPGHDGWVSLHPTATAPLTVAPPDPGFTPAEHHRAVLDTLAGGGGWFYRDLVAASGVEASEATRVLWDLVWAGLVTGDGVAPLRALLAGRRRSGGTSRRPAPRPGRYSRRSFGSLTGWSAGAGRGGAATGAPAAAGSGDGTTSGRWSLVPTPEPDPTIRGYALAEVLLDRYGLLTRGSVVAESVPGGFSGVYRVLAAAEDVGQVRRGYFVEGLGAAQFATNGAVDRLRALARPLGQGPEGPPSGRRGPSVSGHDGVVTSAVVLAATDPANPYGAALDWPGGPADAPDRGTDGPADAGGAAGARDELDGDADRSRAPAERRPDSRAGEGTGHRPGRKAGALVVLHDGRLTAYVERGGKSLLAFCDEPGPLAETATALAGAVTDGRLGALAVERVDGEAALRSEHPIGAALREAGFVTTPRGLRMRR
ncbi:Lhr family ATP-dependent helicase [Agilicoccus flavus]|uniref:Lhr family ATP-dependent helicase n=1 Tax=Agilicoccus flavus TaxID=2775968 RepID=UPI001CF61D81|nr:DEAD/DEAH box helicase [Agilicoccus flavus]